MAISLKDLTQETIADTLESGAYAVVTQDVEGTERVRRVPVSLIRDTALREEVDNIKESLGGAFGYAGTSWTQSGFHSSQLDWVHMECSAGDEITVDVHTASGETGVSGTVVCATNNKATAVMTRPITTGTPITFELTGNAEDFSLYLSALSAQSTVYFSIRKGEAIMDQVDAIAAELADTRSDVADIKDAIGGYETAETSWTQSGSHSSQLDWLHLESKSGDEIKVNVYTDSGETGVYGRVVCATNNKATLVVQKNLVTGTPITFKLPGNAEDFSLYLDPLSAQTTVYFTVSKGNTVAEKISAIQDTLTDHDNRITKINDILAYTEKSFALKASTTHSSGIDRIALFIKSGTKFEVTVATDNGEEVAGTLVCLNGNTTVNQYSITTNIKKSITAENDYTQFGVYISAMLTDTNIIFKIITEESPLYPDTDPDIEVFNDNIEEITRRLPSQQDYQNGVAFVFITDMHWESNFKKSPEIINRICERSRVRLVINGGDLASGDGKYGSDGTWQSIWLYKCTAAFNGKYDYYAVKGNHDTNRLDAGATAYPLSEAKIRQLMMPPVDKAVFPDTVTSGFKLDTDGILRFSKCFTKPVSAVHNYYYFDHDSTTFICLDTDMVGASDPEQIAWAKNVIEITNNPYVIIVLHIVWGGSNEQDDGNLPCTFFDELMQAINELGTDKKAKVQAIFAGHVHVDRNELINGIPVVATDTDSRFANDGIERVEGTLTQQCFDVVVVNYDTKTIYCNRVGEIGTDRTINYASE